MRITVKLELEDTNKYKQREIFRGINFSLKGIFNIEHGHVSSLSCFRSLLSPWGNSFSLQTHFQSTHTHTHFQNIPCISIALHMHNGYALRPGINKLTVWFLTNSFSELSLGILIKTIWKL